MMEATSEGCEVVEDKSISSNDMKDLLTEFLGKKYVRKGLSEDYFSRLHRLKEGLVEQEKKQLKPKK